MTILVTGATGFIGMEVVRRLNAQGVRPRVMVRRATRTALLSPLDVEPVHGDLMSAPALRRAVDGVDTIIHLAGRATFEPYDRLRPTLVDGTARLAHAAAEAGVGHIVFGSSTFVHDGSTPVDDDTPAHPRLDYAAAQQSWTGTAPCGDGENATWNTFFEVLSSYAPRVRVVRVPQHLATGAAAVGGVPLGRLGPTMVSADTVRGWNLDLPVIGLGCGGTWGSSPGIPVS